ncbi:MAG: transcription elongation factor GreA [Chloroflexi bacterium]|nr:MAG: transcription elongation factor GreA [Chloroflexota bacterium]
MSELEQTYLTPEGAEELRRELQELIEVRRPALAQKLKEAVAEGDLRENANYQDAKEQQAFIEGRIQYLENLLRSAVIITETEQDGTVRVGSIVTYREEGMDEDETFKIVGAAEANPREGKISGKSPIGSALLGRKKGDRVRVETPSGEIVLKIKKVE